jgi:type IV secretion system protein VirD4
MSGFFRLFLILSILGGGLAIALLGLHYPIVALLLFAAIAWGQRSSWRSSGAYGTAHWARLTDLWRAGTLGGSGWIMGRANLADPPSRSFGLRCLLSPSVSAKMACKLFFASIRRTTDRSLIRISDCIHAITIAPAGAGKSVAVLIPNLLSYAFSCVVVDPKGELFEATAEHRRTVLGHRIFRFDPFALKGPISSSATMNPLDFIDPSSETMIDDVRDLADSLVIQKGTETDPHWNQWTIIVLAAFMAFVCGCEADSTRRHLGLVRDIVASRPVYKDVLKTMRTVSGFGGVIAKLGQGMTWLIDREEGSVMSSVQRHSSWMDSPPVTRSLASTTFDPMLLRTGKVTVYLILPHDKLTTLAPLLRLWLSTILRVITKGEASEKSPVLFLIDEAANIGKVPALLEAVTLLRGYGIRIWLFFQSLEQLKTTYGPDASVILDNMGTQQYFGINSYQTAEELSKRLGNETILVKSENGGGSESRPTGSGGKDSGGGSKSSSWGWSTSEITRPLMRPEEILTLSGIAIIFHKSWPPIAASLVRYFEAPEFGYRRAKRPRGGLRRLLTAALWLLAVLGVLSLPGLSGCDLTVVSGLFGPAADTASGDLRPDPYDSITRSLQREPRPRPFIDAQMPGPLYDTPPATPARRNRW